MRRHWKWILPRALKWIAPALAAMANVMLHGESKMLWIFVVYPRLSQYIRWNYWAIRARTNPLLRSEIPSGICAKLRTVAASNNRVHMPWSLFAYASRHVQSFTSAELPRHDHSTIACSRHICMVLFFTHIPFVVNHTFNATPWVQLQLVQNQQIHVDRIEHFFHIEIFCFRLKPRGVHQA